MDHELAFLDRLVDAAAAAAASRPPVVVFGAAQLAVCERLAARGISATGRPVLEPGDLPARLAVLLPDQVPGDAVDLLDRLGPCLGGGEVAVLACHSEEAAARRLDRLTLLETVARRLGWNALRLETDLSLLTRPGTVNRRLAWVTEDRSAPMREQFERIFGQPMSDALWSWKYAAGRGAGLGLWSDGELLAHYGGMVRRVMDRGRPVHACQVCDVMVSPKGRTALTRRGPLAQITGTFLEHQIGWDLPCLIGFGFPSDRHFGVARHLGLYASVDEMRLLAWPLETARRRWPEGRIVPIETSALRPGGAAAAAVDALWTSMAADLVGDVVGVRDAAWLRHRYVDRPDADYRLWAWCSGILRRWTGVFVTRDHGSHTELLDLVGRPRHFAALIAAARQVARDAGKAHLHAWITASHLHWLHHPGEDGLRAEPQPLGILVPANSHTAGPDPAAYVGRWFLMSGDTDFR